MKNSRRPPRGPNRNWRCGWPSPLSSVSHRRGWNSSIRKRMYWPGFDEPVECFLFRFAYEVGDGEYTNIGIAGPLCHAFGADLADLPPDDIYAVFAGWQVEHEEIYELDASQLTVPQRLEVVRLERRFARRRIQRHSTRQAGRVFRRTDFSGSRHS